VRKIVVRRIVAEKVVVKRIAGKHEGIPDAAVYVFGIASLA